MGRLLPGLVAAALLAALAAISIAFLGRPAAMSGVDGAMLSASGMALLLSAAAALTALAALRRARAAMADMRRLEISVDAALRRSAANLRERPSGSAGPGGANDQPRLGKETATPAAQDEAAASIDANGASNVVPLRGPVHERPANNAATPAEMLAAAERTADIGLQPIMSIAAGTTLGFDVFRLIECDGHLAHMRAVAEAPPGFDAGAFDAQTVAAAAGVARRRLGSMPGQTLHVALSQACLESRPAAARIAGMAREYPLVAGLIVLCADARSFEPGCAAHASLSQLAAAGFALAAEMPDIQSWAASCDPSPRYIRVPARQILQAAARDQEDALPWKTMRDDMAIIATEVEEDRQAMALLDLGIDLMVGDRFSAPRRIRPERLAEARP